VSEVIYTWDLGDIRVPDEVVKAAGGFMRNGRMHWRTSRRIEQWGAWMAQCELQRMLQQ
jgi:hypothetical protein